MRGRYILSVMAGLTLVYFIGQLGSRSRTDDRFQSGMVETTDGERRVAATPYAVRFRTVHGPNSSNGEVIDVVVSPEMEIYEYESGSYFVRSENHVEHYSLVDNYAEIEIDIAPLRDLYSKSLVGSSLLRDVVFGSPLTGFGGQRRVIDTGVFGDLIETGRIDFVEQSTVCGTQVNRFATDRRNLYPGHSGTVELYVTRDNRLRLQWIERSSSGDAVNGEWCQAYEEMSLEQTIATISDFEGRRADTSHADYVVSVTATKESQIDIPEVCPSCTLSVVQVERVNRGTAPSEQVMLASRPGKSKLLLVNSHGGRAVYTVPQMASSQLLMWDIMSVRTTILPNSNEVEDVVSGFGYVNQNDPLADSLRLDALGAVASALLVSDR